jgi:hypothetical protein
LAVILAKTKKLEISKRHHYIPQFFIKGFAGEDGLLSVFNKKNGRLEERKSPKQIFFEWNRNTFSLNGEDIDFVEKLYQHREDKFSRTYKKIIENQESIELPAYELMLIMYFITELHWRVPNQDDESEEYIKNLTPTNSILRIKDKDTGENVPIEVFNRIVNEPGFLKASKLMRATEDLADILKNVSIHNWKLYYVAPNNPQLHLLSDNPVILKENNNPNILKSELIFPLSKGKTIYHTNGKALKVIPAEYRLNVDVLAFIQAEKYVCGSNAQYLEDISNLAQHYNTEQRINDLKEKVFSIFE